MSFQQNYAFSLLNLRKHYEKRNHQKSQRQRVCHRNGNISSNLLPLLYIYSCVYFKTQNIYIEICKTFHLRKLLRNFPGKRNHSIWHFHGRIPLFLHSNNLILVYRFIYLIIFIKHTES